MHIAGKGLEHSATTHRDRLVSQERFICDKLRRMGYAQQRRIRLYGEEFELVSNPVPDGNGFAVAAVARGSVNQRRIGVPMSLVVTIRQEFEILEHRTAALEDQRAA